jgi:hypothetical protein
LPSAVRSWTSYLVETLLPSARPFGVSHLVDSTGY